MDRFVIIPDGASLTQIGTAAVLRTRFHGPTRKTLNDITHSGDENPHKHGHNPFADHTVTHDPNAQAVLDSLPHHWHRG